MATKKTEPNQLRSQKSEHAANLVGKPKLRVNLISKTELEILNPKLKTPYDVELEDYLGKRSSLLSSRYGDDGKGFHHERVYKVRERLKIEALETPPLHI